MARTPPIRGIRELTYFTAAQERLVRGLALVSLAYGLYWLWWRWTQTLNPDALVFSVLLVSAETWGWFSAALFLFGAWKIPRREPRPAPPGKRVDVFITAFDEPLEVLRRTAMGARAIRYPHRTYFLDDGKRDELKHIADELGIGYIRRVGSANAKAGNLNFALQVTDAEFILQLDADHYPLPNIIHDLLGYFTDPEVAFVQTPQEFYNTDSFTHVVNDDARELWEENRIFYSLLQPGKDAGNAAFFCGCGGMLRRAALDEIGGFSRKTIIEDMETSLILHSNGWKSVYHPAAVAFGLSPGSASAFHVQRQRWAQGSMQILRKLNPLFLPGLTPAQRAHYFAANLYPFDGLQKAMFYAAPVVFLLTGLVPVNADGGALLLRLLPYLLLSITAFEMLARGTGYLFISERYLMAKFFTYIVSIGALVRSRPLKFNVTPKGTSDVPFRAYAPQAVVLGVSVVALIWAPLAHHFGWVTFRTNNFALAFAASAVWALWNIYFAAYVVRMSLGMRQQRSDHRFLENVAVRMQTVAVEPRAEWLASLHNLNPTGLAFRSTTSFPEGTLFAFTLPLSTRPVCAHGRVVHVTTLRTPHGSVHQHGVRFENLSVEDRDAVELHCTQFAVPSWRRRYRQSLDLFARTNEMFHNARTKRRSMIQLPARVWTGGTGNEGEGVGGLLEELSSTGARLLLDDPVPPGSAIRFEVPGSTLKGEGTVVFSHAHESTECLRFSIGLSFTATAAPSRRRWSLRSSRFPVPVLGSGATENAVHS